MMKEEKSRKEKDKMAKIEVVENNRRKAVDIH